VSELIDVRCPYKITIRSGKEIVCNRTAVKVEPGARGEALCVKCGRRFNFDVSGNEVHEQ
jgi:hypothetical protein